MLLPFLLAAVLSAPPQEQVQVSARLSASRIAFGAATTLHITIETRGTRPDRIEVPPMPPGLHVVGTRDFTQTQIRVPGGRTLLINRDVVLRGVATGLHRIPPVRVVIDGREYATDPMSVFVSGTGAAVSGASSESSLDVSLHPDTVYVGEQVLMRAQATFSEDARLRQSRPPTFLPPAPTGFWVQELPDPITVSLRVAEGRSVETQTFHRVYFPLSSGEFHFPPAQLQYEVRRGFLYAPARRELVSDSARITVLPLPEDAQPASFSGAVGSLEMRAALSRDRVEVGEPAVLTVEIEGTGNVKALPAPRLDAVQHAEVFPPSQSARVDVDDYTVGGMKQFRWMIVPQRPGALVIPPIEYAVFDPELEAYTVLRSDTLRIIAAPVVAAAPPDSSLRGLRRTAAGPYLPWVRTPAFAAAQALPLLILFGALRLRRRRQLPPSPARRARQAREELAAIRNAAATDMAAVEHVLVGAVRKVLDVPAADPVEALRRAGRDAEADRLHSLLSELRDARYAPGAGADPERLADAADEFIRDLTADMRGRRSRAWHRARGSAAVLAVAVGVGALAAVLASTGAVQRAQSDAFERGVMLYEQGEFAAAAREFRMYAAKSGDTSAWYDLGLAAWHAGDHGRAMWAWLRAGRAAPRDQDVRHNLEVAGAGDAWRELMPPDRLAAVERLLAGAASWWLLLLALSAVALGARRAAWLAGAAGAVVLATGAVSLAGAAQPTYVVALSDGAALYAAPTIREHALTVLEPGSLAAVLERRDEWLRVRHGAGDQAWVERAAVAAP